jgi:tRNA(Arg) A34 adenosine deaminase TadA
MDFRKCEEKHFNKSITVGKPYEGVTPLRVKRRKDSTQNDKPRIYEGITVAPNCWVELACEEAKDSVERGGGPFGAVLLQIEDETNEVIRYWRDQNHVTEFSDPTAHAEISVIRSACHELGVHNLGEIRIHESTLPQKGETSHCEIYCSCEPCPMCYSAISWARIPVLVFSATRYEAAQPGVEFSDEEIYDELKKEYEERSIRVYQAASTNALKAFELWKRSDNIKF